MDPIRFLTVYIIQGIMGLLYAYLAIKTLIRDTKRLNVVLSSFYLSIAIGVFMNWIYAPLGALPVVIYLNFLTNFFLFWSVGFLTVFNLILLKSEKVFTTQKQLLYVIGYGIFLGLGMFILLHVQEPISGEFGVQLDPVSFAPDWNLSFFLFVLLCWLVFACIPSMYFIIQIQKKFEDENLKKKFKSFSIGVIEIVIFGVIVFISNYLNIPTFRTIAAIIGFILVISGAYLIYSGVGKQISK
jgi:hypothetical protein